MLRNMDGQRTHCAYEKTFLQKKCAYINRRRNKAKYKKQSAKRCPKIWKAISLVVHTNRLCLLRKCLPIKRRRKTTQSTNIKSKPLKTPWNMDGQLTLYAYQKVPYRRNEFTSAPPTQCLKEKGIGTDERFDQKIKSNRLFETGIGLMPASRMVGLRCVWRILLQLSSVLKYALMTWSMAWF